MTNMHRDIQVAGIDTKALATLLMELNIARRNVSAYPNGHPVIQASLKKVIDVYAELMIAREEIVIGITRDALMVEDVFLERSNLVYRDVASHLLLTGL